MFTVKRGSQAAHRYQVGGIRQRQPGWQDPRVSLAFFRPPSPVFCQGQPLPVGIVSMWHHYPMEAFGGVGVKCGTLVAAAGMGLP